MTGRFHSVILDIEDFDEYRKYSVERINEVRASPDAGQVVAYSFTADGNLHAFITGPDGKGMMDLNSLVDLPQDVILVQAMDINNSGG